MSITCKINTPLFGEVLVDKSISKLIYELNLMGTSTMNCCSGLRADHPNDKYIYNSNGYIQFVYNVDLWNYLLSNSDILISFDIEVSMTRKIPINEICWGNNVYISIKGNTEAIRVTKRNVIIKLLSDFIGKELSLI
jgi:hypothetical protein